MSSAQNPRKRLIMLSTSYWDAPLKFRRHKFAEIASRNDFDVFYVNPTFTLLSYFQDVDCRKIFFDFFKGAKHVTDHLKVITMPPLLPFQKKSHTINIINRVIVKILLKIVLRKQMKDPSFVLMVYEPTDYYRLIKKDRTVVVYECVDDHSEYPFNEKIKDKIIEVEKKLIDQSDLLSVTSRYLLAKKKHLHANHILTPNGVDFNLFHSAMDAGTAMPADIAAIKSPVILYVGAVMEWFDYDLLIKIAAHNKDWNIVLIGPQTINHDLFKPHSNIHVLGVKHQSKLPGYLKKSTVCIIPFLVNDLVKGVNPLKLYEYLAAGKPIVSTALPDVLPFEKTHVVHIGKTHQEFIEHLNNLLKNADGIGVMNERADLAKAYSWENIYDDLYSRIKVSMDKK